MEETKDFINKISQNVMSEKDFVIDIFLDFQSCLLYVWMEDANERLLTNSTFSNSQQ